MNKYSFFITKFLLVCVVLTLDQATKYYFLDALSSGDVSVNSFFDLGLVWNKGISFGAFSKSHLSNGIFMIISSIITVIIVSMLIKSVNRYETIAYALVAGGALGNLFDRFERGAVVDFLQFHYQKYYFPAFNFADSTICCGAFILIIYYFLSRDKNEEGKNAQI